MLRSYGRVLRHHSFRDLFLGQAASVIGDQIVIVALALFVTQRTGSATDLGLVLGAQSLALVALLLLGGVWADRLPRQRIMLVADAARGLLQALLAILIFTGVIEVWEMVAIAAAYGGFQAFFEPAYAGLTPQTVPEDLIGEAKALTESMSNVAVLIGPALGTALVLGIGAGEAFAVDALTFAFSVLFLLRALAPRIAHDVYGSTGVFGVLESVAGLGAVVGAVTGLRWHPARPLMTGMLLMLAWPVQDGLFSLGAPLALVVPCAFATGFGFALLIIWWETALARHIPPNALSRVSAWDWMGTAALLPVGFFVAGPLAIAFGARTVLGVGCAIGLVLLALGVAPRSVRTLNGQPPASRASTISRSKSRAPPNATSDDRVRARDEDPNVRRAPHPQRPGHRLMALPSPTRQGLPSAHVNDRQRVDSSLADRRAGRTRGYDHAHDPALPRDRPARRAGT